MKRILDASFRYRPSFETDVRKTFADYRRRQKAPKDAPTAVEGNVTKLPVLRPRAGCRK